MRPSRIIRIAIAAIAAVGVSRVSAAQNWPEITGSFAHSTGMIGGHERSYYAYLPRDLKPGSPLLFVFHGGGGDGGIARDGTGHEFDQLADKNGFVVIYPDGVDRTWTGCRRLQNRAASRRDIDDVAFVQAIIAQEAAVHFIDRKRVFAAGHSMGGQFSYRLALEHPHEFAGIAAISSNLPAADNIDSDCALQNAPMPVMIINGTADPVNPYNGGTNARGTSRGRVLSTEATARYFVKLNGLPEAPLVERLSHVNAADRTSVERLSWTAADRPSVILYTIHGGGHVVPQRYYRYPRVVGVQTEDLDAPEVIWEFFSNLRAN
jgi:polyhydroxybutyrate depolymerase